MNPKIVIRPPTFIEVAVPLIFIAGPILGTDDWQRDAIAILDKSKKDFAIASPRRLIAEVDDTTLGEFTEADFNAQITWEHAHLALAAKKGVTMFWLAKENHIIRGRAFAQTSRFELGEAMVRHQLQGINLVVGIEKGFQGEHYIRETFAGKVPRVSLCDSLEETCTTALNLL